MLLQWSWISTSGVCGVPTFFEKQKKWEMGELTLKARKSLSI